MAVAELVLVDTCIWVPFFNRPYSGEKQAVDELLDDDRGALIGPVLTEILLGFAATSRPTGWRRSCADCDTYR
jgi:hypothetical protein